MKIRFDFVTNSSSSSFVVFNIKSTKLAKICDKYDIPANSYGGKVSGRWESENIIHIGAPYGADIATWFANLLNKDFMDFYYSESDIKGAIAEINANEKEINKEIGFATIELGAMVSDDEGSSYYCYEKKNGKIMTGGVDDSEWDYKKEGETLCDALSGDLKDLKKRALHGGFVRESTDPYCLDNTSEGIKDGVESSWMKQYGGYVEKEPIIDFDGTLFVFSGLSDHYAEKDHPIVEKVIAKGGQYRCKISGKTNYLVVEPWGAGDYKINCVIEQLEKGKNIKVVLLDDLKKALAGKAPTKVPSVSANTDIANSNVAKIETAKSNTAKENVNEVESLTEVELSAESDSAKSNDVSSGITEDIVEENIILADGFEIDSVGTLIEYTGNAKDIVIPDAITKIGEYAFSFKENLSYIVIPEGVEIIENSAFNGCTKLVDIVLPSTIRVIGEGAFESCWELESISIPDGCKEIGSNCFFDSTELNDIYVPSSVCVIGDDAFNTLNDSTTIHTPSGSFAEYFAKENGLMVDNKEMPIKNGSASKSLKQKKVSKPTVKPAQPVQTKPQPQTASTTSVEQASVPNKTISKSPVVEKTDEVLMQEEKANRRIKELEEQIKSNNNSSSNGSGLIAVGVLLVMFFLYCVIDNYNSYQISSAFYPSYYLSTDSITVSLVLLAISLIVVVFGFVKKSKGKKIKKLNIQLQEEINLLKDPKNHASYFENKNNKENQNAK